MAEARTENTVNFLIQRIYVKDLSFEAPLSPHVFKEKWEPQLALDLQTRNTALDSNAYDVVLQITATVKQNDKTIFLAEVKQAGVFTIDGLKDMELQHALNSYCPNILFPYAREAISDMVTRGGFPQLVLAPVNFDALYQQQLEKRTDTVVA